jgi:hypothetical protein
MSSTEPTGGFPGVLYAGDGMRLAGIGPDTFTTQMDDALPFKALVSGRPPAPGDGELALDDRLWVLPDWLGKAEDLPTALLCHLASLIRAGGKVGLASRDELVCDQAKDMLLLALATPEGQA